MSFFSKLKDKIGSPTASLGMNVIQALSGGKNPISEERKNQSDQAISDAQAGLDLKKEQFDLLRQDSAPLRQLRDENISRLLRLSGIGGRDLTEFNQSPEFTTVRDAALKIKGTGAQSGELAQRANELATGEYGNYFNRVFNTAGFSSSGLNDTNKLLQQNVDAQVGLLNNAGATAANNILNFSNQKNQAASTGLGILGAFCDARLKKNIRKIGSYHSGLGKYEWDWTEKGKELAKNQPSVGPMAHEVFEIMPENITTVDGYLMIKDMRLINAY